MKRYISLILILILVMSFGAAAFADYTISASAGPVSGGTVSPASATGAEGAYITFSASPAAGFIFDHWEENGTSVSTSASYTATVGTADSSLLAVFSAHTPHTYGDVIQENYTAPTESTEGSYDEVQYCTVCGQKNTLGHKTIPAIASVKYTVSVSAVPSAYGTVSGNGTYDANATATVTAMPNTNYVFVNWTDALNAVVSTNQTFSFSVTANTALKANFAVNPTPSAAVYHTITYLDDNGALIAADSKEDNVSYYISHARAVKAGYTQVAWRTTKDTSGTTYDFGKTYEANADLTLYPVWTKTGGTTPVGTCTLTFAPGTYGTGAAFSQWFYSGTAVTLPGAGYFTRSGYTQTGWSYDPNGSTCDKAPAANTFLYSDTTLYPYWSADTGSKTVYIDYSDYGAVYWGNAKMERGRTITLKPNESVTLTFSPVNQYYVYNVNVNGYNLGSRDSYTFSYNEMTGNKSIYVKFGSIYGKPKTGDDSNLGLWIILGMSSMAGCAAAVTVSKKRREY